MPKKPHQSEGSLNANAISKIKNWPSNNLHVWKGHEFFVTSRWNRSTMYMFSLTTVVLDKEIRFLSKKWKVKKDFEFEFLHEGQPVKGHLKQLNLLANYNVQYRLTVDGEVIGESAAKNHGLIWACLTGLGIAAFIVLLLVIAFVLLVIFATLQNAK